MDLPPSTTITSPARPNIPIWDALQTIADANKLRFDVNDTGIGNITLYPPEAEAIIHPPAATTDAPTSDTSPASDSPPASTESAADKRDDQITDLRNNLRIENLKVQAMPLDQFVQKITKELAAQDSQKQGLNFVLHIPPGEAPISVSLDFTRIPGYRANISMILEPLRARYPIRYHFDQDAIYIEQLSRDEVAFHKEAKATFIDLDFSQTDPVAALQSVQAASAAKGFAFDLDLKGIASLDAIKKLPAIDLKASHVSVEQALRSIFYLADFHPMPLDHFSGYQIQPQSPEATKALTHVNAGSEIISFKLGTDEEKQLRTNLQNLLNATWSGPSLDVPVESAGNSSYVTVTRETGAYGKIEQIIVLNTKLIDKVHFQVNPSIEIKDSQGFSLAKAGGTATLASGERALLMAQDPATLSLPAKGNDPALGFASYMQITLVDENEQPLLPPPFPAFTEIPALPQSASAPAPTPDALLQAVQKGDAATLQKLIDEGADPKAVTGEQRTLLFDAGSPEVAEILIAHGIDPNARDKGGDLALTNLCRNGGKNAAAMVRVLLKHGADPNVHVGELGETPLMDARDGATVDVLMEYGADPKVTMPSGENVFFWASWSDPSTVEALLRHGVAFDLKTDGATMLLHATWNHNIPLVKWLLEHGVDSNTPGVWVPNKGHPDMMLPMKAVAISGVPEAAKLLLEHGAKGDEATILALQNHYSNIVKLLWEHGVRNISELCYSISQNAPLSDLEKILQSDGTVDPPQDAIITPLGEAAEMDNFPAVQLLVQHGADVNKGGNPVPKNPEYRDTPLVLAANRGQDEIAAFLLQHGARPDPQALYGATNAGIPNAYYIKHSHLPSKEHYERVIQLLIDSGALKNITPELSGEILTKVISPCWGDPDPSVMQKLLAAGLSPEAPMPYIVDNGEKPNSVIGYYRDYYQKYKDDPVRGQMVADLKPLIDMLEAADKGAIKTTGASGLEKELLTVRTFLVPYGFFKTKSNNPADMKRELISHGIEFSPDATVTYLPEQHKLVVRNMRKQLDKIAALIETFPDPTAIPQPDPPANITVTNAASSLTFPELTFDKPTPSSSAQGH